MKPNRTKKQERCSKRKEPGRTARGRRQATTAAARGARGCSRRGAQGSCSSLLSLLRAEPAAAARGECVRVCRRSSWLYCRTRRRLPSGELCTRDALERQGSCGRGSVGSAGGGAAPAKILCWGNCIPYSALSVRLSSWPAPCRGEVSKSARTEILEVMAVCEGARPELALAAAT